MVIKIKFLVLVSFLLVLISGFPFVAKGAMLYLEPSSGQYQQGDVFIAEVRIDTQGECINAVEVNLVFPENILEIKDFSKGGSILSLWVEEPSFNNGLVSFSGGIPGGYCGIISGDPGQSNVLGKLVLRARETDAKLLHETEAKLEILQSSQVLLNDGKGTPAEMATKPSIFTIMSEKSETITDEWYEEIKKDIIAPELFEIEIYQNPDVFDGKYFITFFTDDKQTGLDYYEIKQGEENWQKAQSPFLLKDQELKSIIKVRAIDKAGNQRIAEYIPLEKPVSFPFWIIILVLISFIAIIILWQRIFKK